MQVSTGGMSARRPEKLYRSSTIGGSFIRSSHDFARDLQTNTGYIEGESLLQRSFVHAAIRPLVRDAADLFDND